MIECHIHLVDVQRTLLARAQHTVTAPLEHAPCATLAALRDAWQSLDEANRMYVAGLQADDLAEIVRYTNSDIGGEPRTRATLRFWGRLLSQDRVACVVSR